MVGGMDRESMGTPTTLALKGSRRRPTTAVMDRRTEPQQQAHPHPEPPRPPSVSSPQWSLSMSLSLMRHVPWCEERKKE